MKESGLGWTTLSLDDGAGLPQDIRNDVTNWSFATPVGVQDVTGIDKSAMERLALLRDFTATMNGVFNPAANRAHAVLSTVPTNPGARTLTSVVSLQSLAVEALVTDYALTRGAGGELTWTAPAVLQDGTVPVWT